MPINNGNTRSIFGRFTTTFAVLALIGATMAAQAGAQDPAATCNGLPATRVITELADAGAGTTDDDVIVIDIGFADDFEFPDDFFDSQPIFVALEGNDTICIRSAQQLKIYAGLGNDTIIVEDPVESPNYHYIAHEILGGSGDDTIINMATSIYTQSFLDGGSGNDTITGGVSNDYIFGGSGDDVIRGGDSHDYITGGPGNDMLYGGYGDDFIDGDGGDDSIFGSRGNDELRGNLGADTIYGGPGNDNLSSNVNRDMNPHAATNEWEIDTAGARMFGGEGDDMLWGSNRWDRMQGGPGNDILAGFEGRDYLRGGPGNDQLIGGTNIDDMNGNTGADRIFIQDADKAQGGFGNDECGGFTWEDITIPASCETEFSTTMAMINMNMMNGAGD